MAVLTEEQSMLKDQAQAWVRDESPVQKFRQMRDSGTPKRFDEATWSDISTMGWAGILVPEELGGSGMDYATFGVVLEETGRQLVASPLFASGLVGASALMLGGSDAQQKSWLPDIAAGKRILTLAVDEGPHHGPIQTALSAEATDDGYTLNGQKVLVFEGVSADGFVVAARTAGGPGDTTGITLFVLPADTDGIEATPLKTADSRGYANVAFNSVSASVDCVLGEVGQGFALLEGILDRARAGLAAEMLGIGAEAFDRTLEYLKTRKQFGVPIGKFQVLQHRMVDMISELERATSMAILAACLADDEDSAERSAKLAAAKFVINRAGRYVAEQCIQLHGGIAMTWEYNGAHYAKRLVMISHQFGDDDHHLEAYAAQLGAA